MVYNDMVIWRNVYGKRENDWWCMWQMVAILQFFPSMAYAFLLATHSYVNNGIEHLLYPCLILNVYYNDNAHYQSTPHIITRIIHYLVFHSFSSSILLILYHINHSFFMSISSTIYFCHSIKALIPSCMWAKAQNATRCCC